MRIPTRPPSLSELLSEADSRERFQHILNSVPGPTHQGRYLHWDRIRYYEPPADLTHREWWLGLALKRSLSRVSVPLRDLEGNVFGFTPLPAVLEHLHRIDLGAGGKIEMQEQITNPQTRDRYYVSSLMEEAITSSQLEGASTTRRVAKEMLRVGREPRDRSEQMILNNYRTMQAIGELRSASLSSELVCRLHRLVTENTLDDPTAAGRLRREDEEVVVADGYNVVIHRPPLAGELPVRLELMCEFANGAVPNEFVHPVLRAIILHFWLAYDHPFVDGNGRTARALFYWCMLRHGYWLFEFVSISKILLRAPIQYAQAFLYTETDSNDLSYFILYQASVINRAIDELHRYIEKKTEEIKQLESRIRGTLFLNPRQRALISHALRHPHQLYTIHSHQTSHSVVYQTARTDLQELASKGLLDAMKQGKTWIFRPSPQLEKRLQEIGS